MKKKILLIEDDGAALGASLALEEVHEYDLYWERINWQYAESWIEDDPGIKNFYALIFDLKVPDYNLKQYSSKPYNEINDISPTLYFIEHFIKPNYGKYLYKIILVSAYIKTMGNKYEEKTNKILTNEYRCIDKLEGGSLSKLTELLKELK